MPWLETQNVADVQRHEIEFWTKLKNDIDSGHFWADEIKGFRTEPDRRLALALDNLPLPGAFREAIIALRAIIREKRKKKECSKKELSFMYWLMAIESFMVPRSFYLEQPGYNVMASTPCSVIQSLSFSYNQLGYKELQLANKTDSKWFVEMWNEPQQHTTLNKMHSDVWRECEIATKILQGKQLNELLEKFS